jgi:hypothetical protein
MWDGSWPASYSCAPRCTWVTVQACSTRGPASHRRAALLSVVSYLSTSRINNASWRHFHPLHTSRNVARPCSTHPSLRPEAHTAQQPAAPPAPSSAAHPAAPPIRSPCCHSPSHAVAALAWVPSQPENPSRRPKEDREGARAARHLSASPPLLTCMSATAAIYAATCHIPVKSIDTRCLLLETPWSPSTARDLPPHPSVAFCRLLGLSSGTTASRPPTLLTTHQLSPAPSYLLQPLLRVRLGAPHPRYRAGVPRCGGADSLLSRP